MFKHWRKYLAWLFAVVFIYAVTLAYRSWNIHRTSNGAVQLENQQDPFTYYAFTFGHVKEKAAIALDSTLVYTVDYGRIKSWNNHSGRYYNPVTIALNALRAWQDFQYNQSAQGRAIFLANARWLRDHQTTTGSWSIPCSNVVEGQVLKANWTSALSQGLGLSVLCRAWHLEKDSNYLFVAEKALLPLAKSIDLGGVAFATGGGLFFEEYPVGPQGSHVLNGHLYTLFGLYDYWQASQSSLAGHLFAMGLKGLDQHLPEFDAGTWSRYSLLGEANWRNHYHYSSPWYQKLHATQLQALAHLTGEIRYQQYAERFRNQHQKSPVAWGLFPAYVAYTDLVRCRQLLSFYP